MNSMFFGLSLHFFYEVMMGFFLGGDFFFINGFGGVAWFWGVAETTEWSYAAQFAHYVQIAGTRA